MIHRLQLGDILQVKSGKKAGRWYCKAKIPAEYRDAYKDSQATAWLGSGSLAGAQALLPTVKEKEQQRFLAKVAMYDPLLVAAKRLYGALFSNNDDITGRNLHVQPHSSQHYNDPCKRSNAYCSPSRRSVSI